MPEEVIYHGRDLEAMSVALNYHRWILDFFQPHLGRRIVEVGAGTGSFSEMLLECPIESISLVEPSKAMYEVLTGYARQWSSSVAVKTHNTTFRPIADRIKSDQNPDTVVYVNVLEHVDDDIGEIKAVYNMLNQGGKLCVFVPAMQSLYTRFDEELGHFRRYSLAELEEKCRSIGFRVLKSRYFDMVGLIPWWIRYKLLGSKTLTPRQVDLYDKLVVPWIRLLESAIRPPVGKNVILVAERI